MQPKNSKFILAETGKVVPFCPLTVGKLPVPADSSKKGRLMAAF